MDEGDHKGDRPTTALTTGKKSALALRAAWVLMLIVGLVPFLYGTGIVAGLLLRALGNPSFLSLLESPAPGVPPDIYLTESGLTTFFWGLFIITVSWKGLRAGARWAWYLLMFVPVYYAAQAAVGWPIDASLRLFLISLSTPAVVLPIGYFMGHKVVPENQMSKSTKRSRPITVASVLFIILGLGIGLADPLFVAYIAYYHTAPILPIIPGGGNVLDDSTPIGKLGGLNLVIALGIVHAATSILGVVAGFWLWQSRKRGGMLGMGLLPVDLFFAYGFGVPILWLVSPLRSILLILGWRSLN